MREWEELPQEAREAKRMEEAFGISPLVEFNRHFSAMMSKMRTKPREAISHARKAEDALVKERVFMDKESKEIIWKFRSIRSKISQGMVSGVRYTARKLAKYLEDEEYGISPKIGEVVTLG